MFPSVGSVSGCYGHWEHVLKCLSICLDVQRCDNMVGAGNRGFHRFDNAKLVVQIGLGHLFKSHVEKDLSILEEIGSSK